MATVKRLKYPAPRREYAPTGNGLWASKPWGVEGILSTVQGGGWFGSDHEFESGCAEFAQQTMRVWKELME